jgi:hypothetical protein
MHVRTCEKDNVERQVLSFSGLQHSSLRIVPGISTGKPHAVSTRIAKAQQPYSLHNIFRAVENVTGTASLQLAQTALFFHGIHCRLLLR